MPKKRTAGEGTINQLPSGSWRAQVSLHGKRLSYTAKSQQGARDWIRKIQGQIEQGLTYDDEHTRFGVFLTGWLASKKLEVRTASIEQYSWISDTYLLPKLGKIELRNINPAHIQNIYDGLSKAGKSPQTIRIVHVVLNMCLQQAKNLGLIARNPVEFCHIPKKPKSEMTIWDEEQVNQFLVDIRGHRNENLYCLALGTGMRRGELLGLKWQDIDWLHSRLMIYRQVINPEGGGYFFQAPKTSKGLRSVQIGPGLIERMKEQMKTVDLMRQFARDKWQEHDLVFPGMNGKPQYGNNITIEFEQLVEKSGLPRIRFHDCRHTAASIMLAHGIHPTVVASMLGHSMSTLMSNYTHFLPDRQTEAAQLMDEVTSPIEIKFSQPG